MKVKYSYYPSSEQFSLKVVPENKEEYFELIEADVQTIFDLVIDQAKTELKNSCVITDIEPLDDRFAFMIKTKPVSAEVPS